MMQNLLKDIKVVELASVLAGPEVGKFFAELGAKVVKVENPNTNGDVTRGWRLPSETGEYSAYYAAVNYNKEVQFLDIKTQHKEVVELLTDADVVITNFKPGDAARLKLDFEYLQTINPKLIYASLKGFANQPNRVAYDVVLQAETGFMSMNGTPGSGPVKMPVAFIDLFAAHQMKEAVLLALWQREKTGKGMQVKVSLEESALASLANQATNWLMIAHEPQRLGSLHPNIAPYGEIFLSKDRVQFVLAVGAEKQFVELCEMLFCLELKLDDRYSHNQNRVEHRQELAKTLQLAIEKHTFEWLSEQMVSRKIPFGKIKSVSEVLSESAAKNMRLEGKPDGTKRLSSVAFTVGEG